MRDFRNNHYVPEWYQRRFLPPSGGDGKFYYLDLAPERAVSNDHAYTRNEIMRWGPPGCFFERDLYTTRLGQWESTDIERRFFGRVDREGRAALEYFAAFEHPSVNGDAFQNMMRYMSLQKLRTPKGLTNLAELVRLQDKNRLLQTMQRLQQVFCAIWSESVWSIVDASHSETKFLLSDHPVTVYNLGCFPASKYCRNLRDPDIRFTGTHTLFPLSRERLLILTNLSWARNPYTNPLMLRPNPELFRTAVFNFTQIQTGRALSETEVCEINFIIKERAKRYIAASEREWLYPELKVPSTTWDKLGGGYLLMPDPRSMTFSSEMLMGYSNGRTEMLDEYGRRPWQSGYGTPKDGEWESFLAFQGEYARVFGPKRRGLTFDFGKKETEEDTPDFHAYHLRLESKFKPRRYSSVRRRRPVG